MCGGYTGEHDEMSKLDYKSYIGRKFVMTQKPHPCGEGIQRTYKFLNGLSVSAIKTPYSYGKDDEWEIAVMYADGSWATKQVFPDSWDDVIGYISDKKLFEILEKVDSYGS